MRYRSRRALARSYRPRVHTWLDARPWRVWALVFAAGAVGVLAEMLLSR